jgi:hypothetical protein
VETEDNMRIPEDLVVYSSEEAEELLREIARNEEELVQEQ